MSFRCLIKLRWLTALTALTLFLSLGAQAQGTFKICAEPDSLPYSDKKTQSGFEIDFANLIAKALEKKLIIKWAAQRDHSYIKATIGAGGCDAIMGVPAGFKKLTTTIPWYRTGFEFVALAKTSIPHSFDAPELEHLKVGVPATGLGETAPVLALTSRGLANSIRTYSVFGSKEMFADVKRKVLDMAIVWGPYAGWLANNEKGPFEIAATPDKDHEIAMVYDFSIGVRKEDETLKEDLNKIIENHRSDIHAILEKWHVPLRNSK